MRKPALQLVLPSPCGQLWQYVHDDKVIDLCGIDGAALTLTEALMQHVNAGSKLTLLTPTSWWQVFNLSYPKLSKQKAVEALKFEAEPLSPLHLSKLVFADPCGTAPGQATLLIGLDSVRAGDVVTQLQDAGLLVDAVIPLSLVIARAIQIQPEPNTSCRVASAGFWETVEFTDGEIRTWTVNCETSIEKPSDTYRVAISGEAGNDVPDDVQLQSISHADITNAAPHSAVTVPAHRLRIDRSRNEALARWSTPAAIIGLVLMLIALGLARRALSTLVATRTETAIQVAEYAKLYPNSSVPLVIRDRLASSLRSTHQAGENPDTASASQLERYRDTLLALPRDSQVEIERIRFDQNGTLITGTARTRAETDALGQSISSSATVQTTSTEGGRIQFEARDTGGPLP